MRYFRARVSSQPDHGLLHFLIEVSGNLTADEIAAKVPEAAFIRAASAMAPTPVIYRADLEEIDGALFAFTKGAHIGFDELPGMRFFWIR